MRHSDGLRASLAGKPSLDPYFANVSLLLHGDGTNGSTTFTDNSNSARTLIASGNAQIDTSIKQFGTGSLKFDGSGDYATVSGSAGAAVFNGDFTFECWLYRAGDQPSGYGCIFSNSNTSTGMHLFTQNANFHVRIAGAILNPTGLTPALNTWQHFAVTRSGSTIYFFLNGTISTSTMTSSASLNGGFNWTIGGGYASGPTSNPLFGYLDDIRITSGVARYTASFTPPTAPFPDS